MRLPKCSWLIFFALVTVSSLSAAEITGKVRDASVDSATVVIEGDALPAVGDSAEIYFKVPGADEEISVAGGKVAAVDAKAVKIKIEKSTGTIAKDQLARFKSGSTPQTPAASPSPASSPSTPAAPGSPITGDWSSTTPHGTTVSFSFKEDGTLLWVIEEAQSGQSTVAKYRLDPSTKPQSIELFDFEEGHMKGEKLRGIFELQSDGRLKLDFMKGPEAPPLKEFSKEMLIFFRATSPIVRSNKPEPPTPTPDVASTPSQAPTPSPDEALVAEAQQRFDRRDYAGAIDALSKAIALNPKNAKAFFWRGQCFYGNDNSAALADFEKAMELDPSMKLQELITGMKAARKETKRAKETATPARSRKEAKP